MNTNIIALTLDALKKAEAALSDIGDADREPGDDVAWCEARAAEAIPQTRAAIAALEAEPPKQEAERDWSTAQDWRGMDGAIAWHLIDRHADGWDDVGAMMNAWLAAQAEPQPTIPEGWGFCSADFSLQASGVSEFGGVMLIRTGADRADWHFLTDEQREVIPLYVSGTGKTVVKAIASAAKNCTPLPTPPKD